MTHHLVKVIVYAKDENSAIQKAKQVIDEKTSDDGVKPFDFYLMFGRDHGMTYTSQRFGDFSTVCLAESEEGKKLLNEGMEYTKDEFFRTLDYITKALETFTPQQIFEENGEDLSMFRYYCGTLDNDEHCTCFGDDGERIENFARLECRINKWRTLYEDKGKENPLKDLNVYVVPFDCHN